VAIVGGGIAGLTVADELLRRGVEGIVLLEAKSCGAGATGRSSGFITPPSELGLQELRRRFGDADARTLWQAAQDGCATIAETIDRFSIECGRINADSLFVASGDRDFAAVEDEHRAMKELGFASTLYGAAQLQSVLGSSSYGGGVRFGGTFAIDPHEYVQALAASLEQRGLTLMENVRVAKIADGKVESSDGTVRANRIFVCTDFESARLNVAKRAVYHAQTFIALSEVLPEDIIREVFPRQPLLVWDNDLIYQYFRLTTDRRLLVGGGLLSRTYASSSPHDPSAVHHIVSSIRGRFPVLERVRFEFDWNGLIGVTKDLLPLAGSVGEKRYVALCASGLPWSVVAAQTAVRTAMDGSGGRLEQILHPRRSFTDLDVLQPLAGKPVTFALSHAYAKAALRGDATKVRRRKLTAAAAVAALVIAKLLRSRRAK